MNDYAGHGADCPFCAPPREEIALENALAFARYDKFPVSPGHTLIMPKRHVADYFALSWPEQEACWRLVNAARAELERSHAPEGYNVGVNVHSAGGQGVWHAHIHVIPRYQGDVAEPLGGIRNILPRKRP
jgi:diadenosine tetraphosphate (Ap4A) HIT family hydrolase